MSRDKLELVKSNRDVSNIDQNNSQFSETVLRELFQLLEDYSPMWYTEKHHSRAAAALGLRPPSRSAQG